MTIKSNEELFKTINALVGNWCDRRALMALRCILPGWPLMSGLTDEWELLLGSLKDVRALAQSEVTQEEMVLVDKAIVAVDKALSGR